MKQYLFIADSFQELNPKKDTTLFMMRESIKNNVEVFHACIEDILFKDGEVLSRASFVKDVNNLKLDAAKKLVPLKAFDRVFMRKEPPVDTNYMNALHLLGLAQEHGVRISNNPNAIQNFNEKVFATYFSDLMPKTLITSNIDILKEFYNLHKKIIIKPLDGMGGESIYKIESLEERELLIIDELTNSGTRMIMVQEFIEEIFEGDFRVLIINGIPFKKVLARIPQNGSFKGNLAAGGRGVAKDISNNQLKIANAVSKRLSEHGIDFAGIDIIGNYLTEINITCPTCACEIYDQTGENPIEVYLKENE